MRTSATPDRFCSRSLTKRSAKSVTSIDEVAIGRERQVQDRLGVRLDLRDDGLVDLVGQARPAHARHAVAHVVGGGIGIAGQPNLAVIWLFSGRLIELM